MALSLRGRRLATLCAAALPALGSLMGAGSAGAASTQDFAYVGNLGAGNGVLAVFNTSLGDQVATVPVGEDIDDVVARPGGAQVFATGIAGVSPNEYTRVVAVSTTTNTVVGSVSVPLGSNNLVFDAEGDSAYVGPNNDNTVKVIDAATLRVVGTFTPDTPAGASYYEDGIALSPNGKTLYEMYGTNQYSYVVEFDTATGTIKHKVTLPGYYHYFAVSPDGTRLYATGLDSEPGVGGTGYFAVVAA